MNVHAHTRPTHRLAALGALGLLAAGATLGLALGAAAPALAHDQLSDYGTEVDNSTGQVSAITLSFSDKVLDAGTEIRVLDADDKDHVDGAPQVQDRAVRQAVSTPLPEGIYSVIWRVVSSDGHPIEGLLAFELDAAGEVTWIPAGEGDAPKAGDETPAVPDDQTEGHADHDHAEASGATDDGGPGTGAIIAIAVGAAVVVAGAVTATVVLGHRRRERAMAEAAPAAGSTPGEAGQ